ncbi:MAG: glycosyltransferase family 2 protein [Anaerolineaceae bacterium]|nr:glycosyltransferase family 2 protein [Anaerolineaceae bacterium]
MLETSLYIVIPVHNRVHFTRDCLVSLQNQTVKGFHIIVVDDGSIDGTREMIQSEFPQVILLEGDGNLWWTGAINIGVQYALDHHAKYILTLNDDTRAPDQFLEKMLYWADREPNALLGALAVDANTHQPVYGGERIRWDRGDMIPLLDELSPRERFGLHEVTHFPGRGFWVPAAVYSKIGKYDQRRFPHYAADYDFTHRAIRAGYQIYCNYDASLFIYPEASDSVQLTKQKNLRNYYSHLFGIKGAANLKIFTRYAVRNCPRRYLPWFLFRGYIQRIFGYWFHYLLDPIHIETS